MSEKVTLTRPTLTVGDLRERLTGVPDDLPITVYLPEEPGSDLWTTLVLAGTQDDAPDSFWLDIDYEPGEYTR